MAARENQGLQIALIIFVMLTIILTVTTFLFFRNYQEGQEKIKSLTADNQKKDTDRNTATADSAEVKAMISDAKDSKELAGIKDKDIETNGKTLAEGKRNYHSLVEFMATELKNANTRITEITTHEKQLADELKAKETANTAAIATYTQNVATTAKELETERKTFGGDRAKITKDSKTLAAKFNENRKDLDELTAKSREEVGKLTGEVTKVTKLLQDKNDEGQRLMKSNEVSDGKVTWVNQRSRKVWINVGTDDGLRRQTSFSVFSADAANPREAKTKGKIEVIQLMDRHLAEARIVDDNLADPMMPGDQIFSPTWEAGRPEHFAFAGVMDIDNDGDSDRARVRDLVALNGGIIDAEVADDGKRTGEMSINTKYLVLGSEPTVGVGDSDREATKIDAYGKIIGEAKTLGVKQIPVKDFLDYMGYKPEDRTVGLGKAAKSTDFKARFPDGVQRVAPGSGKKDLRKTKAPTQ